MLLFVAGCGPETGIRPGDIRSYSVPKAVVPAVAARAPAAAAAAAPGRLRYEVPEGWSDRGATGMRLASLAIGDPAAGHEVTVIPAAGTLRGNVERWQKQLMEAAADDVIGEAVERTLTEAETIDIDGTTATVVLLHDGAGEDGSGRQAILGAMIPVDDSAALFVKFKGDAEVARREREKFLRFVSSLRWK